MTDMISVVARAIAEARWKTKLPPDGSIVYSEQLAKAAIAAMRSPTLAMITAAGYLYTPAQWKDEDAFIAAWMESHDWPRMIDAVLEVK